MKVLRLTNSDDVRKDVPDSERTFNIAARHFQEATGEPAEFIVRVIWPSKELPDIIDSWVERYQPDVVQFGVNGFWYIYKSIPLKLERSFGPVGRPLAKAGFKAGDISWFTRTSAYHAIRSGLLRTVGGATYFEIDEVVEIIEASLRRILRHEDVSVVIRGSAAWESDPARDVAMYLELVRIASQMHVHLLANDPRTVDMAEQLAGEDSDRLHSRLEARERNGMREAEMLANVWRERNHLPPV